MDVRHMRQVLAIHRNGSFVKAALELGVAQPTLSKSISRIEDELGLTLFDRSGVGAKVTPMGAVFVERAGRVVAEAQRLVRDVELAGAGELGEARLGIGTALRSSFVPTFSIRTVARYPRLRLQMIIETREHLLARLLAGGVDLMIAADGEDMQGLGLVKVELMREQALAYACPDHPLAGRQRIPVAEFGRYPGVSPTADTGFATGRMLGLDGEAAQRASFFVVNDYEVARQLAVAGLATMVAPEHLMRASVAAGELVQLDLDWSLEVSLVAAMTRAASHSPVLQEIVTLAQEVGRGLTDGAAAPPAGLRPAKAG